MSELTWQKSSFSSGDGSTNCVELARVHRAICLRESDDPPTILISAPARMAALLDHIRAARPDTPH
jgi:hypothetical protein